MKLIITLYTIYFLDLWTNEPLLQAQDVHVKQFCFLVWAEDVLLSLPNYVNKTWCKNFLWNCLRKNERLFKFTQKHLKEKETKSYSKLA